ncbi:hypothetical protein BFL28_18990 [Sphingomonas turrisvirgatae]|uniref:Cell wall polymerase n=2 Tax=Sphingomonas turrisvirgatae TaxID=1888892 RepID=A0A1E3LTH8_9SPHN|nr:hypothetical protein BFL28_18990 [Sphingomonas turrisvirgatae]
MNVLTGTMRRPRALGLACAIGAVLLGLSYMAAAGAPAHYLAINGGALLVGIALLLIGSIAARSGANGAGRLIMAIACALLATTWLGYSAEGATRWIKLAGVTLQPSLILLPVAVVIFARYRGRLATIGMILTSAALALQPDRAMAGMLVAGLAVLAIVRVDRAVLTALAASMLSFAVTLVRADDLGASLYVDQILFSSFDVHALAGMAVLTGAFLLLIPAILGGLYDEANRDIYLAFGAIWLAAIIAAALGNYPTPLVGYGGSAIIGYVLSLAALPLIHAANTITQPGAGEGSDASSENPSFHLKLA